MSDRLLVIDDDPDMGALVERIAKRCGYAVSTTVAADDFLARLEAERPTHAMVDLQIPSLDGIELLRELARRGFAGPVLILSGMDTKVVNTARRFGTQSGLDIVAALTKPVRASVLSEALQAARRTDQTLTEQDIAGGLDRDEFFLVYQPKIHLATGGLAGFEALVRWRREGGQVWPPDRFLGFVESGSLADRFSETVTALAARQQRTWATGGFDTAVAVNLSAANIRHIDVPDRLFAICRNEGAEPGNIQFEITETAAMQDDLSAMDILTRLRIKGFGLALDDFGTGYSSLARLQKMPFDEMKIDRGFVVHSAHDSDARVIVGAVVSLGRALGLRVVAEGIESAETCSVMSELGCDGGQGFHIGAPMSPRECEAWVGAHRGAAET